MLDEIQDRLDAVPFTPFQLVLGNAVSCFTPLDGEPIVVISLNA